MDVLMKILYCGVMIVGSLALVIAGLCACVLCLHSTWKFVRGSK